MRARVLVAGGVALVAGVPVALADGGSSIATAPVVPYDSPQTGTHATGFEVSAGESPDACPEFHSFWTIAAREGDRIVIDWHSEAADVKLQVFPRDTTDATFVRTPNILDSTLDNQREGTALLRPTRSGSYPLDFYAVDCPGVSDDPSPYDFTATVQRRARLSLRDRRRLRRTGSVPVGVRAPDGRRLEPGTRLRVRLQLTTRRRGFRTVGAATGTGPEVRVRYRVPARLRGRRVRMRALATGAGYVRSVSAEHMVRAR